MSRKYKLTKAEIAFIESMVRPMEADETQGGGDGEGSGKANDA